MSRRRTKAEEIRNPENYFNRYVALEIQKEWEKKKQYYNVFDSLDEMLAGGSEGVSGETLMILATNLDGEDFDRQLADTYPLAWIDLIENPTLYAAIMSLPQKDKYFLTLRYKYCLSQTELAALFKVSQAAISKQESALKKFFKKFFKNGYRKS